LSKAQEPFEQDGVLAAKKGQGVEIPEAEAFAWMSRIQKTQSKI
jgi:hypothetical protein